MSVPANRTRVELEMVLGTDRLKLRAERLSVSSGPAEWQRQAGNGSSYCVMNYVVRDDAQVGGCSPPSCGCGTATQKEDRAGAPPVLRWVVFRVLGACAVTDVKGFKSHRARSRAAVTVTNGHIYL